jgi:glycosyltransferase involved in cell wall biosynthesis
MKLCHIVPSLEARHGGPSKSVKGLCSALARRGEEVELLTTDAASEWQRADGALRITAFRRDWPQSICASGGLRNRLRQIDADIIHHHSIWLRTLHYAHKSAKRSGASLVVSPRGMMDPWAWNHHARRKSFARRFIHPRAFEDVDGWHATSASEEGALRSLGFKQPICVAPNGVSSLSDQETSDSLAYWRNMLGPLSDRPVALFYSRFHRKKRLIELIDIWSESGPEDWLLLIVGIPEEYNSQMIGDYVLRVGCKGRILAFNGTYRPSPYPVASLFLLPSHGENFGLSIAESMANGVPVVVTDSTPWSEINGNGAGWCVPWSKFPAAVKSAIAEGTEGLRLRGEIAREWVLGNYSWDASAKTLVEFYSSIRARSMAPAR